jgi:hypothetical protein
MRRKRAILINNLQLSSVLSRIRSCCVENEKILALLSYALILAILYAPVVFDGKTLMPNAYYPYGITDDRSASYDGREAYNSFNIDLATPAYQELPTNPLVGEMYRNGDLPLWNPYQASGTPFAAQYSTRVFFPYQILEDLSPYWLWDFFLLGRLLIAGFFTFLFLRAVGLGRGASFLGGLFYMFSGAFVWFISLEEMANVAITMPILLFALERLIATRSRWHFVFCAISTALVLIAGQPETAIYVLLAAALYGLYRVLTINPRSWQSIADITRVALSFVIGAALSAFLLIPFFEFVGMSHTIHPPGGKMGVIGIPPKAWFIAILMPTMFTVPSWERTLPINGAWDWLGGFIGVLPAFLAILGLARGKGWKGPLILFASIGLVILLKNFGVKPFLWLGYLPLLDQSWSQRWAGPVWTFSFSAAAAFGFESLKNRNISTKAQPHSTATTSPENKWKRSWRYSRRWFGTVGILSTAIGIVLILGGVGLNRVVLEHWFNIDWLTGSTTSLATLATFEKAATAVGCLILFCIGLPCIKQYLNQKHRRGLHDLWWVLPWLVFYAVVLVTNYAEKFYYDPHPLAERLSWENLKPFVLASVWGGGAVICSLLIAALWLYRNGATRYNLTYAVILLSVLGAWFFIPSGYNANFLALKLVPVALGLTAVITLSAPWRFLFPRRRLLVLTLLGLTIASTIVIDKTSPSGFPDRQDPYSDTPYITFLKKNIGTNRVMATDGLLYGNYASAVSIQDVRFINALGVEWYQSYADKLVGYNINRYDSASLWLTGAAELPLHEPNSAMTQIVMTPMAEAFMKQEPYYSLLGTKYLITPQTKQFMYADGYGDWSNRDGIAGWTTGSSFLDIDSYKSDALVTDNWRRVGTRLAPFSDTPQELIYKFQFDSPIKEGTLSVWYMITTPEAAGATYLSSDGVNWGEPVVAVIGPGDHFWNRIPLSASLIGQHSLYVKFVASTPRCDDSVALEQWGIWIELERQNSENRCLIEGKSPREVILSPDLPVVYDGEVVIYENPDVLPRTWIAHEIEYVGSYKEAIDKIGEPNINLKHHAFLEEYAPGMDDYVTSTDNAIDSAEIIEYKPNWVVIKASTDTPGMLILSDVFYPGWDASIDGQNAHIYRVDGIIRGVFLSPGEHTIIFKYVPSSFVLGSTISIITLAVLFLWALIPSLRKLYNNLANITPR